MRDFILNKNKILCEIIGDGDANGDNKNENMNNIDCIDSDTPTLNNSVSTTVRDSVSTTVRASDNRINGLGPYHLDLGNFSILIYCRWDQFIVSHYV
jgi:hypothetical protein